MDTIPIELKALERVLGDPSAEPIKVSYGLLRSVTDNFSREIGRGGFGVVFLGYLGNEKIAVKKLSNGHIFSYKQFLDEIMCLIMTKHKNIVRFLGYCSDTLGEVAKFDEEYVVAEVQEKLLVFEYVPNGNIQHYIEEKPSEDDWHIRYKMINGICQGLQYLHEERIGHLDLKPENVMLDSHMEPKIADFGLSRFLGVGNSVIYTANIAGTMGYIAPETMRGEVSFMSDIYSLGIIVIRLLTGPGNIDFDNWYKSLEVDFPQRKTCIDIARACVEIEKSKRPTIGEIIDMLNDIGNAESSTNQGSSRMFPWTELLDADPLELVYPTEPNRQILVEMDDEAHELEALEHIMSDANAEPIKLSYRLLRSITDNFSNEIGRGGYGVVYQGVLRNGHVAVKKLLNLHALPEKQFVDEITVLKIAKHKNIVRFLGYCSETQGELLEFNGQNVMGEAQQKLLCFEYVPNGNIKHYLQQEKSEGANWPLRYQMIRGICQGLQFLHTEHINHLDLKPENVLLDAHMDPKITNFGLSIRFHHGQSEEITENIVGTLRYIAPETIDNGRISFKTDVYALGIIIIELLTGTDKIDLHNLEESLDDMDCPRMRKCTEIARNCIDLDRHNRPTVFEVIHELDELDTSRLPGCSNQVTSTAFPGTELVGLCPLEISFPFVGNKEMLYCQMSLTNKTNNLIFCLIQQKIHRVQPMNSRAIQLSRKREDKLPSDTKKYEMQVLIVGENHKKLSTLSQENAVGYFKAAHELFGFQLHRAILTARIVSPNPALLLDRYRIKQGVGHDYQIDAMDVHPMEPWVLIVESQDGRVYIWNWQTDQTIGVYRTGLPYAKRKMVAKFIARKDWVVVGRADGSIHVLNCPSLGDIYIINEFNLHDTGVTSLEVHPTRSFLLSSCSVSVKVWDWNRSWSCIGIFKFTAHVRHVMFYPKLATTFASFHEDGKAMMWKIGHPNPIAAFKDRYNTANFFSYIGDRDFIAGIVDHRAIILDLQKEKIVHTLETKEIGTFITAAVSHPTRPILITTSANGFICVWDYITYRLKKAYESMITGPLYIGFTGSRRLVVGNKVAISVLDIDLE